MNNHYDFSSLAELSTDGITLTCTATQMVVEIPKSLLAGDMVGTNVRFENSDADDESCWGYDKTQEDASKIIMLTTNLTACGTNSLVNIFTQLFDVLNNRTYIIFINS